MHRFRTMEHLRIATMVERVLEVDGSFLRHDGEGILGEAEVDVLRAIRQRMRVAAGENPLPCVASGVRGRRG